MTCSDPGWPLHPFPPPPLPPPSPPPSPPPPPPPLPVSRWYTMILETPRRRWNSTKPSSSIGTWWNGFSRCLGLELTRPFPRLKIQAGSGEKVSRTEFRIRFLKRLRPGLTRPLPRLKIRVGSSQKRLKNWILKLIFKTSLVCPSSTFTSS